jgi:hypothetical protein
MPELIERLEEAKARKRVVIEELKAAVVAAQNAEKVVKALQEELYELDGPLYGRGWGLIKRLQEEVAQEERTKRLSMMPSPVYSGTIPSYDYVVARVTDAQIRLVARSGGSEIIVKKSSGMLYGIYKIDVPATILAWEEYVNQSGMVQDA